MSGRQDRGIVLVAVLFAVAIMSLMVVAASALTRSGIASEGLEQSRLASHLALRSGLESAKALIVATPAAQRAYFEGAPLVMDLGRGFQAEVSIRDAAGLPDLNRTKLVLVDGLLGAMLGAAEAAELSARIAEWRVDAAEKAKAAGTAQPAMAADSTSNSQEEKPEQPQQPVIFHAVDQLKAMTEADAAVRLSGRFTVFNPTGLINPLAAPDDVLLAIPGFTRGDLAAIKSARKTQAAKADQGLEAMLERLKPFVAVRDATVFIIGVRLSEGPGIITNSTASAVVQIAEQGPLPFRTLSVSGL
jgi:type II secretory pathway component PulK